MKKVLVWGMVLLLAILVVVSISMVSAYTAMDKDDIILDVHQNANIHDMVVWYAELNGEVLVEDEIYLFSQANTTGVEIVYMINVEDDHYKLRAVSVSELIREYENYLQERRG